MDHATSPLTDALLREGVATVRTLRRQPGHTDEVVAISAYTTGFEAGLALGLLEPTVGHAMLEAIDAEMLANDTRATVLERQAYLEHYRQAAKEQP